MTLSLPKSPWFYRLLNLLLLGLIAWQLAGLIWLLLAPKPKMPVAIEPRQVRVVQADVGQALAGFHLFGQSKAAAASGEVVDSSLPYKLRGIITATKTQPAAAIFSGAEPKETAVREGESIQPGVELISVAANEVLISNNGRRERIKLDDKPAVEIPVVSSGKVEEAPAKAEAVAKPEGGSSGAPMVLRRKALAASLQSLNIAELAKGLGTAPDGGILVEDLSAQPVLRTMGVMPGDVLKGINGQDLAGPADISVLFGALGQQRKATLRLVRRGRPLSFAYSIQN